MTLRKVASLDDLWSGEMIGLVVDGVNILLINVDDHIYAYSNACPHQKNPLSEGTLSGRTLRCARHEWEFDACTGHGINPEDACMQAFTVTIDGCDIFLDPHETRPAEVAADEESQPWLTRH